MASEFVKREWVYLSPHFDDAALSCGGLAWEQAQAGDGVSIWTICGGTIPDGLLSPFAEQLHTRWGTGRDAVEQRRAEDSASCQALQAAYRHFPLPDCIYRRAGMDYWAPAQAAAEEHLYASEDAIFGAVDAAEAPLIAQLSARLGEALPAQAEVVCPLALGGHVDHRLTRMAAEALGRRAYLRLQLRLWYYADYPYVLREEGALRALEEAGAAKLVFPITTGGLRAWQDSIAAHGSQISTFWDSLGRMEDAIAQYLEAAGGGVLWRVGV